MYSFEGDFRQRPHQNLGGLSTRPEREKLLQHAHKEREKREEQRRRLAAILRLQAFARGCLQRARLRTRLRNHFDMVLREHNTHPDVALSLDSLLNQLLFLYSAETDSNRLIAISQLILRQRQQVLAKVASDVLGGSVGGWPHYLRCLIWRHLQLMVRIARQAQAGDSLAISLRVVEVFGNLKAWDGLMDEIQCKALMRQIYSFIIKRGYFEDLRILLELKVPPMLEKSAIPPTHLAASILSMVILPLDLLCTCQDHQFRKIVSRNFCVFVLGPRPCDAVTQLVLPALTQWPNLPFAYIIDALAECMDQLQPSLWLLHALLGLASAHLGRAQVSNFLQVVVFLLDSVPMKVSVLSSANTEEESSEFDSDSEPDDHPDGIISRDEKQCLEESLDLLNDFRVVQEVVGWLDQQWEEGKCMGLETWSGVGGSGAVSGGQWALGIVSRLGHILLLADPRMGPHHFRLLYSLAYKPLFLRRLWMMVARAGRAEVYSHSSPSFSASSGGGGLQLLQALAQGIHLSPQQQQCLVPPLALFCSLFSYLLITLHDTEFYGDDQKEQSDEMRMKQSTMPFSVEELPGLCRQLRDVCLGLVELAFPDSRPAFCQAYQEAVQSVRSPEKESNVSEENGRATNSHVWAHLLKVCVGLLTQLHARDTRRPFCPEGHWISTKVTLHFDRPTDFSCSRQRFRGYRPFHLYHLTRQQLEEEGPPPSNREVRLMTVLREVPFVVPFAERVEVLQQLVVRERAQQQGEMAAFLQGPIIQILVRRNYLYEDAFEKLSPENEPNLKLKMRVQLVNMAGVDEAGIDGGGVFREFLSEVLRTGFDPNRGFFRLTHDNLLYPNPSVRLLVPDFPRHYFFLGRLLGKALYENMLVELPLAYFFLAKLLGKRSTNLDIHHLASLDPLMHRSLLSLMNYTGDVAELGLDFTLLSEELGETRVEELKPGGAQIPVTSANRIEYIHLVADFKLNREIRAQCSAFRQGLANVMPLEWLHMFSCKELQVLISGATVPIDLEDLRTNSVYSGGYTAEHPTIRMFWKVVETFNDQQRRQLLKFVTSCSRPPLLGFRELYPPFCVQNAGSEERLPTASTCMNLLKLPEFGDEQALRDKLLYAVESGSGFELS